MRAPVSASQAPLRVAWLALVAALVTVPARAEGPGMAAQTATIGGVSYFGGRVISNAKVVAVFWGPNVDRPLVEQIGPFYRMLVDSPYLDWLGEYDTVGRRGADGRTGSEQRIGRGSYAGAFTIAPRDGAVALHDADIQVELAHQLAAGVLPAPELDAQGNVDTVYMIEMPPEVTSIEHNGTTSCADFCAYHGTLVLGRKSVPYGVFPALVGACVGTCGHADNLFDAATSLRSHELAEAITDAEVGLVKDFTRPLAWADPTPNRNEIGDRCAFQNETLGGFTVQKNWSNAMGACIATRDLPVCVGSMAPCRPCTTADEGAPGGCSGATPTCATDAKDPLRGACVACTTSEACPAAAPVCDRARGPAADTCRGCRVSDECASESPVCDVASGRCVGCLVDADCDRGATCDARTRTCVDCATSDDCPSARPTCRARHCIGCHADNECPDPARPVCDAARGACVASADPRGTNAAALPTLRCDARPGERSSAGGRGGVGAFAFGIAWAALAIARSRRQRSARR
jgi:hypothetical protein